MLSDNETPVTKDICKILHSQVKEKEEEMSDHLAKIDDSIVSLNRISEENQTIIKILMEERSARMNSSSPPGDRPKIWQAAWFKYVVITACTLILLLTIAALSDNVITQYIDVMKSMPK